MQLFIGLYLIVSSLVVRQGELASTFLCTPGYADVIVFNSRGILVLFDDLNHTPLCLRLAYVHYSINNSSGTIEVTNIDLEIVRNFDYFYGDQELLNTDGVTLSNNGEILVIEDSATKLNAGCFTEIFATNKTLTFTITITHMTSLIPIIDPVRVCNPWVGRQVTLHCHQNNEPLESLHPLVYYRWRFPNGTHDRGYTTTSPYPLVIPKPTLNDSGNYYCTSESINGVKAETYIPLDVRVPPAFNNITSAHSAARILGMDQTEVLVAPSSGSFNPVRQFEFTCRFSGNPRPSVEWINKENNFQIFSSGHDPNITTYNDRSVLVIKDYPAFLSGISNRIMRPLEELSLVCWVSNFIGCDSMNISVTITESSVVSTMASSSSISCPSINFTVNSISSTIASIISATSTIRSTTTTSSTIPTSSTTVNTISTISSTTTSSTTVNSISTSIISAISTINFISSTLSPSSSTVSSTSTTSSFSSTIDSTDPIISLSSRSTMDSADPVISLRSRSTVDYTSSFMSLSSTVSLDDVISLPISTVDEAVSTMSLDFTTDTMDATNNTLTPVISGIVDTPPSRAIDPSYYIVPLLIVLVNLFIIAVVIIISALLIRKKRIKKVVPLIPNNRRKSEDRSSCVLKSMEIKTTEGVSNNRDLQPFGPVWSIVNNDVSSREDSPSLGSRRSLEFVLKLRDAYKAVEMETKSFNFEDYDMQGCYEKIELSPTTVDKDYVKSIATAGDTDEGDKDFTIVDAQEFYQKVISESKEDLSWKVTDNQLKDPEPYETETTLQMNEIAPPTITVEAVIEQPDHSSTQQSTPNHHQSEASVDDTSQADSDNEEVPTYAVVNKPKRLNYIQEVNSEDDNEDSRPPSVIPFNPKLLEQSDSLNSNSTDRHCQPKATVDDSSLDSSNNEESLAHPAVVNKPKQLDRIQEMSDGDDSNKGSHESRRPPPVVLFNYNSLNRSDSLSSTSTYKDLEESFVTTITL